MSDRSVYPVPAEWRENAWINRETYEAMYRRSIEDRDGFWAEQAREFLSWEREWDQVCDADLRQGKAEWFRGGRLNVATNCIDRHLATRATQPAIIWEPDNPAEPARTISYRELHASVSRLANVLKQRGVTKGDRVCIYLPMIPEAAFAMLACARIGAIHTVVFGGFSPEAIKDRVLDADCRLLITSDEGLRGGKLVPYKQNVDTALQHCPDVTTTLVVRRTGGEIEWNAERDVWYHEAMEQVSDDCPAESMDAEDPLFILYTSGSTGKPKGVLHTTGGYLLQAAITHKYVFDYRDGDVFWCTADVGWITGHSYIVYGPLCNGAITVMFEGVPTWPDVSRFWEICDKHSVATLYTAPTAIRSLMAHGDEPVKKTSRASLRLLGTVGEPINPEGWEWYHRVVGEGRCPIVDTWWQTETGAHMLAPLPGAVDLKPGSATLPFFGVDMALLDTDGREVEGPGSGSLVIKSSWPGQLRTLYGDHQRLIETYFSAFPGYYATGDGARRDEDGYYWITGRMDDVVNVSGHRLGTAEIESALLLHPKVAEAAVVGFPHPVKGQAIYAYVTLMSGLEPDEHLQDELMALCAKEIGAIAKPEYIQWAPALPKTRSGKIMRRILRKIACNELEHMGDISTLADESVVRHLIDNRLVR